MELTDQGMVRYALNRAYLDGATYVVFERGGLPPLGIMAKLAALLPRQRTNLSGPSIDVSICSACGRLARAMSARWR